MRVKRLQSLGIQPVYHLVLQNEPHDFVLDSGVIASNSHSRAYAEIGYWTAYLKAHYTLEFMTALLSQRSKDLDQFPQFIHECRELGLEVKPPDVNESGYSFTPVGEKTLRWGLGAVKHVGKNAKLLIKEAKKAPFTSIHNLVERTKDLGLNKSLLESLIKAGAMDSLISNRGIGLQELENSRNYLKKLESYEAKQISYTRKVSIYREREEQIARAKTEKKAKPAKLKEPVPPPKPILEAVEGSESSRLQELQWERELLGTYISDHPITFARTTAPKLEEILANPQGERVSLCGAIDTIESKPTKKGNTRIIGTISDDTLQIPFTVFGKTVEKFKKLLSVGALVELTGKLQAKENETPELLVHQVAPLYRKEQVCKRMTIDSSKLLGSVGGLDLLQETGWHQHEEEPFVLNIKLKSGKTISIERK